MSLLKKTNKLSLFEAYKQGWLSFKTHWKSWIVLIIFFLIINALIGNISTHLKNTFANNIILPFIDLFLLFINGIILPAFLIAYIWEAYKSKKINLKKVEKTAFQFDKLLNLTLWMIIKITALLILPLMVFSYVFKITKPPMPLDQYLIVLLNNLSTSKGVVFWIWLVAFIIIFIAVLARIMFVEYEIILKNKGVVEAINTTWHKTRKYWGLLFSYQVITPFIFFAVTIITASIIDVIFTGIAAKAIASLAILVELIIALPWMWLSAIYIYDKIFKK